MKNFDFGLTKENRKDFVAQISDILDQPKKYLGTPSYAFTVGDYTIDRNGIVTGEYDEGIFAQLVERGYVSLTAWDDEDDAPEAETEMEEAAEPEAETDTISITMPLDGFTPESLDNLCRMVTAKEPLIEKALGVEAIPIRVLENGIEFPWFRAEHSNDMMAYAQFISALCTTAKEKKRVTAKPQEHFENERFTLRVWLIGLGLVGSEYSRIRQILTKPLSGNGAWRYGAPEKAVEETASAPQNAGKSPADEALGDTPTETESANVDDINADTAEDGEEVSGDEQ
ncbi:MAG: hypothetical protein FWE90_03095 [Defluviitaleaceae bacterium]|nr:hypothetical protein [Defluviitaleaceae bacterium]